MARVHISIGSNIEREKHIRSALQSLREQFGELTVSTVYESDAVGFEGDRFYNLVAAFETELPPRTLVCMLQAIERAHDRERGTNSFESRTLDLDLLLYDDMVIRQNELELPRSEITRHAFVLRPLAEIAGDTRHPVSGETFAELWSAFDTTKEPTWPAEFCTH